MLKSVLRPIARSRLGKAYRPYLQPLLSEATGSPPAWFNSPDSWHHTISDAFFWRLDSLESRFDLMNMYSLVSPSKEIRDLVKLIVFSKDGREIQRLDYELEPHETKSVLFGDVLDIRGMGTFFVFHSCENSQRNWPFKTCLTDRGYTAFRRGDASDPWGYVHGCCNTLVLAYDPSRDDYYPLTHRSLRKQVFRPQLRFDDCRRVEVLCSNPLARPTSISVRAIGVGNEVVTEETRRLTGFGSDLIELDNASGDVIRIEVASNLFLYRPLIFKHYANSFDVLHS